MARFRSLVVCALALAAAAPAPAQDSREQRYADDTADLLVSYLVAPGRALYVGVNRRDARPGAQPAPAAWQFFAKISYAFQL